MYGTVARMRAKQGRVDDIVALFAEWDRESKPKVAGALNGYVYRLDSDPHELIMCVTFRDKASYVANADNPEQDKWFQRLREHIEADPVWSDGEIVHASE